MRWSAFLIGLAAALTGSALWGQAKPAQAPPKSEYEKAYAEAYEKSFRAAFRSKFIEQCLLSAPKAAAAGYDIKPICTCGAETLLATNTLEQLNALSKGSSTALQLVMTQCLKSDPPVVLSKP